MKRKEFAIIAGIIALTTFTGCNVNQSSGSASEKQLIVDYATHGVSVNPKMYGIFFEEINHAGDGVLYAELIRNRNFEEHVIPTGTTYKNGYVYAPHSKNYLSGNYSDWKIQWKTDSLKMIGWRVKGDVSYDVVSERPLHRNTPNAMKLQMKQSGCILENEGYWGIAVKQGEKYDLRFYLNAAKYKGNVLVKCVSANGTTLAEQSFAVAKSGTWQEYTAVLTTSASDTNGTLQLVFDAPGTVYVDYVSLFPQRTFKNRPNGMRPDVAQKLADLKPGFMRWPGGCIVEGATYGNRAKWEETLGDPMTRHSEWILWNYHCTWGFGYHEFLQFCEDIGADAMFVANVGLSCTVRNGDYTEDLKPVVQDICNAIEYATGDATTTWGAKRAAAGHSAPFPLKYVELGNEQSGDYYAERYNYLYSILKPKYPDITFICTLQLEKSRNLLKEADMIDPHWYSNPDYFYDHAALFDTIARGKYDIYVGEFAAISAANMQGALSEAAFMTGMEHNGDLVKMASYAPLIENSNHRDWPTNLIWANNDQVFGRTSYHVQAMFSHNIPTYNLPAKLSQELPSPFSGYIGLGSDSLESQYRNFKVTDKNGKVLMDANALATSTKLDKPQGGNRRFRMIMPTINLLKTQSIDNAVVEFEARKMQTMPAFVFGADDTGKNYYTLNLGSTRPNSTVTVTRTVDGMSGFSRDDSAPAFSMTDGQWYKFRVELKDDNTLVCSVDGKQVLEKKVLPLNKVHAIAGYDTKSGETVIKFVNGTNQVCQTAIALQCSEVQKRGKVITLASVNPTDENTYSEPEKVKPVTTEYLQFGKKFNYTFAPNSFTILRIKTSDH